MTSVMSLQNVAYPCWLRLAKKGTTVTAYVSIAGPYSWTQLGSASPQSIAANSQIGLFSSSTSAQAWGSHAFFDEFGCTIQGITAPPTQSVRQRAIATRQAIIPRIAVRNGRVEVTLPQSMTGSVAVVNTSGRIVARVLGGGKLQCGLGREPAGMYVVRIVSGSSASSIRTLVR
jgi:hypothetical protein